MSTEEFIESNGKIDVLFSNEHYFLLNITDFDLVDNIENNANKETDNVFEKLLSNLKFDGFCGSTLLGYYSEEKGKIIIISGNHRLKAIKKADIKNALVIVPRNVSKADIARWHLSHNHLTGELVFENLHFFLDELKTKDLKIMAGFEEIQKQLAKSIVEEKVRIESFDEKMLSTELLFNVDDFDDFKKKYEEANIKDEIPKIYTGVSQEDFNKIILYIKDKKNVFNISKILIELLADVVKNRQEGAEE